MNLITNYSLLITSFMKILHIVPTYLPAYRYGGPIKSVHGLNKWVAKEGAEVTVYTTNIDGGDDLQTKTDIIDGVKIYYFKASRFLRSWFYSRDLRLALRDSLKDFDIIHITSVFLSASYFGAKYAKRFNKPYIISPRGSLITELIEKKSSFKKKLYISLIEKKNLSGASAIHFTTELEKEEYLKLGLPLNKAIVIANGVEMEKKLVNSNEELKSEFRIKFNIPGNAKIVLSLGRLNWKKGFDTLIPAFAEVVRQENNRTIEQENNLVLVIVGGDDEGYKKEIQLLTTHHQLPTNSVIFTGDLRGEDKAAAYQSADMFVMPSYSENFGGSVVEAMARSVPVVITEGVGITPDVREAKAGIVIEKNEEQLAKAILGLLRDDDLRKALGERGRKLVEEKYSWPNIAKKWLAAYNELV